VPREPFPPDAEIVPGDWIDLTLSDETVKEPENAESIEMKVSESRPEAYRAATRTSAVGTGVPFELTVCCPVRRGERGGDREPSEGDPSSRRGICPAGIGASQTPFFTEPIPPSAGS